MGVKGVGNRSVKAEEVTERRGWPRWNCFSNVGADLRKKCTIKRHYRTSIVHLFRVNKIILGA